MPWSEVELLLVALPVPVVFGFRALISTLTSEEAAETLSRPEEAEAGASPSFSVAGELAGAAGLAEAAVDGLGLAA